MTDQDKNLIAPLIHAYRDYLTCIRARLRTIFPKSEFEPLDNPTHIKYVLASDIVQMLALELQELVRDSNRTALFDAHSIFNEATQAQIRILLAVKVV